jgi:carbamoyl-phosphate synthase large subunit
MRPNKVLVVGSGPIKIGEAAEFDYSGSQALKAFKEEGIKTVIINSNVATVQTSYEMADKVYLLPVSKEFVEKVIVKERPDAIAVGFGGQLALNAGVDLWNAGVLKKYKVNVLGTKIEGIKHALSRSAFSALMKKNGLPVPPSASAKSEREALSNAKRIGYPVMLRVSFNLGGRGSIVAHNEEQLKKELKRAFAQTRVGEVLIEKYLKGWKEIEYEVVRDAYGNCAVVACLENLDPMGVHTGDSVVVAPAQTLDNYEYQEMRSTSIRVAETIGLIGECNVQFALNPESYEHYVIETNPRMSRSSALASKVTGYPLAYVSAKLALGYKLYEVQNSVSKATTACFEPSLDYITIKMPRWDLDKFEGVENKTSTEMKSIGEVMALGRNFEEAFQKATRMLDIGEPGIAGGPIYTSCINNTEVENALKEKRPYWFLYAAKAFKEGMSVSKVHTLTDVDKFFLEKIRNMVLAFESTKKKPPSKKEFGALKKLGFMDKQIGLHPPSDFSAKQVDTLAGEWPAKANYLYTTHVDAEDDAMHSKGRKLIVLGAGVFRIGVSVEFDHSAVSLASSAKEAFDEVSIINYNPETVSTDWDRFGKLYFDELNGETILGICRKEKPESVAAFAAGQIGNNLARSLERGGVKIFGTNGRSISAAEDRKAFSSLLERIGVPQPAWAEARSMEDMERFVEEVGFPVLIRPSYVLSGSAMNVATNPEEARAYLKRATSVSPLHPVVLSKFLSDAEEAELDCASDGKSVIGVTLRHIEEAGVHSGDATMVTPAELGGEQEAKMKQTALEIAQILKIRGPFNLQFIIQHGRPYVIELNLRASRSMPFSSKSVGIDLMRYSVKGITGIFKHKGFLEPPHFAYAIKSPQFSWAQLRGSYPFLSPEMKSTGESAAFGRVIESALLKSWLGATPNKTVKKGALVYGSLHKAELDKCAENLSKLFPVYTLEGLDTWGEIIKEEEALKLMNDGKIEMVVTDGAVHERDYLTRRRAADLNLPLVLNARLGKELSRAILYGETDIDEMRQYWKKSKAPRPTAHWSSQTSLQ